MALLNTADVGDLAERLRKAIAHRIEGSSEVEVTDVVVPQSNGMSNDTILFAAAWTLDEARVQRELVARVAPTSESIFPSTNFALETRVLGALAEADVPVPGGPVP